MIQGMWSCGLRARWRSGTGTEDGGAGTVVRSWRIFEFVHDKLCCFLYFFFGNYTSTLFHKFAHFNQQMLCIYLWIMTINFSYCTFKCTCFFVKQQKTGWGLGTRLHKGDIYKKLCLHSLLQLNLLLEICELMEHVFLTPWMLAMCVSTFVNWVFCVV